MWAEIERDAGLIRPHKEAQKTLIAEPGKVLYAKQYKENRHQIAGEKKDHGRRLISPAVVNGYSSAFVLWEACKCEELQEGYGLCGLLRFLP